MDEVIINQSVKKKYEKNNKKNSKKSPKKNTLSKRDDVYSTVKSICLIAYIAGGANAPFFSLNSAIDAAVDMIMKETK